VALPKPVSDVTNGGDYWAPFGKKRWSAVRVISVTNDVAEVNRVDPSSNEPKTRRTKVNATQLVKRDSSLNGDDRPTVEPEAIFNPQETEESRKNAMWERLLALLPDKSTTDDW